MNDLDLIKMFEGLNRDQAKELTARIKTAVQREAESFGRETKAREDRQAIAETFELLGVS